MQMQAENQPYDEINVTPMLDLAYVLLVIFIIMTTASVQGVKVDTPKTELSTSLAKPSTKAVTITAEGNVFIDAYPVTMEQLDQRIAEYKSIKPNLAIVIKGDARAQYAKVMEVMETLKRHDITDLGLATSRMPR